MMSGEWMGIDWLSRGWLLMLGFTAAVLVVAALRKPCRYLFGTERAFELWLLPPLAMLVSQLPHAADAPVAVLPPVVFVITSAAFALPSPTAAANAVNWRTGVVLMWFAGCMCSLLLAMLAQARYRRRLRGASAVTMPSRWPVLRAAGVDVGPALVGAWRARIVLPADFEQRYDAGERALILSHETAHARRGDGWWCLLARFFAALCWFHPLAWWALAALRHDQELACDAAVLRGHGEQRRCYANAMLKTQSAAFALPVGCTWSPRHPLTERIAMLNSKPRFSSRRMGVVTVTTIAGIVATAVYAAVPASSAGVSRASDRYTLRVDIGFNGQPAETHFTRCLKPGEFGSFNGSRDGVPDWHGRFAMAPTSQGEIEVRSWLDASFRQADGHVQTLSTQPVVRTPSQKQATILVGAHVVSSPDGEKVSAGVPSMRVDLTPSAGCADRLASPA